MKPQRIFLFIALCALGVIVYGKDWWEYGNFYQIYPRSLRDSDGDGIGDLIGITEKLQFLKDVGFTAVWLSPIFKSPMTDFGYDISDFFAIQPEYGTLEDFKTLIAHAKEIGMPIILDFVPNHSSDENEWFIKSENREAGYEDFYVWANGTRDANGQPQPPSNWLSAFRRSAWQWSEKRQQFYLHQFSIKQADLNYRNPLVKDKMKEVLRYWLDLGVSGFRIDALPYIFETEPNDDGTYPDEPVIDNVSECTDPEQWCHLQHIYTKDQPESIEIVYEWREFVDQYKKENGGETRVLLTEAYTSLENLVLYYGDGVRNGSNVPFNFYFFEGFTNDTSATEVVALIKNWLQAIPEGVMSNWVLGNHDNSRIATRFGEQRVDLFNILLQTLPGVAVTYNGEEIGMSDGYVSWAETVDPQGCSADESTYQSFSRDPARTPYQWDATKNAGFSEGNRTWLPVADNYRTINVQAELNSAKSHLQIFMKLVKLRQETSMQVGALQIEAIYNDVIIYSRQATANDDLYVVVLNLGSQEVEFNINDYFEVGSLAKVITSSIQSNYADGVVIDATQFVAEPYVGVVLVKV